MEKFLHKKNHGRELISIDILKQLCFYSYETGRQLGLLIDRAGKIEYVLSGTAEDITAQRNRLQREAFNRYGTMFTERNLRIVNAYNRVMNDYARRQVARAQGLSNG